MRFSEISETAAIELAKKLPSLKKHDYDTIDKLMKDISKKHRITGKALHDLFVRKYKKTPDQWVNSKKHYGLTTEHIHKSVLNRTTNNNQKSDWYQIHSVFSTIYENYYEHKSINRITESVNNLLPHIRENMDPEVKSFYDQLANRSKNNHVPVKIGAKLCVLQAVLDAYSSKVILKGFVNPKTIVDIHMVDDKIQQIEFDDGTVFPEKYEFSTTEFNVDLLNTFFFPTRNHLEHMITAINLIKPESYSIGTKLLAENKTITKELDLQSEVDKFCDWACQQLHIKTKPTIELSMDTEEAQNNHHTGGHQMGEDSIWVYAKNRNLVDILRTVFHELVHVRQGELDMIKPGDSYPGSPIEVMADMLSGKYIKIYGEKNHHIFQ